MIYGQIPVPQKVLQSGAGLTIPANPFALPGFKLPNLPIAGQQPYQTQQRTIVSLAVPIVVNVQANKKLNQNGAVFCDLYVNSQVMRTVKVDLESQAYLFGGVNWTRVGVVSMEFQTPVPLPNPATLELGFHGLCPEPVEGGTLEFVQVSVNTERRGESEDLAAQGAIFYSEDAK